MICLWGFSYLGYAIGTTHNSWWALPLVLTAIVCVAFEFLMYGFVLYVLAEREKEQEAALAKSSQSLSENRP